MTRDSNVASLAPLIASAISSDHNAAVFNSVVNRLFSSGLTLASVLNVCTVNREVHQRLTAVITELDEAVGELRTAAFANSVRDPAPQAGAARSATVELLPKRAPERGHIIATPRRHAYAGIAGFARALWVEEDA